MTRVLAAVAALAIVLHLAQSVVAAAMFFAFVAAFLFPATVLVSRIPRIRDLEPDLRLAVSAAIVIVLSPAWYFARKASGMPLILDAVACLVLVVLALKPITRFELRTSSLIAAVPFVFAIAWLGHAARTVTSVRYSPTFGADFGNLVSIVTSLRASSMLPLAHVVDGGPLQLPWLFFTLPATLADFLGLAMPHANALILTNLLMALLLVHTTVTVARGVWPAAIALFAPVVIHWLGIPTSSVLPPLTSMLVHGDTTFALVLALLAFAMFERRAIVSGIALAGMAAYLAFDVPHFAFNPNLLLGLLPLWLLLILRGRQRLTIQHLVIVLALFVNDAKAASLIAVACAPLIAIPEGRRREIAMVIVAIGLTHSAADLLQFRKPAELLPAGYHDALIWARDHTPRNAVVIDPASVAVPNIVWPMVIAERRVWLPTRYTDSITNADPKTMRLRLGQWQATRTPHGEVTVLAYPCESASPFLRTEMRFGTWSVCLRKR